MHTDIEALEYAVGLERVPSLAGAGRESRSQPIIERDTESGKSEIELAGILFGQREPISFALDVCPAVVLCLEL